jgi:hypothetical protein
VGWEDESEGSKGYWGEKMGVVDSDGNDLLAVLKIF